MSKPELRIHAFMPYSRANGPGVRAVIWVQGCTLGCPGCFNPGTHPPTGGKMVPVEELFERVVGLGNAVEGLTVSGGEPLQQLSPLLQLLRKVRRETSLSALVFTGYTREEVQSMPGAGELLRCVDVLISGRYDKSQRLAVGLRGSSNQTVHFLTTRYSHADLLATPEAEVLITPGGEVITSGIAQPDNCNQ